ncbi:MAG TPA: hypothetical protein PK397_11300 [Ignavibacteriaceae bacterium]|nr:hypothetical protein [Ignavibacteriaceae bacterium]
MRSSILMVLYCESLKRISIHFLLFLFICFITACSDKPKETTETFNGEKLKSLFISANTGSRTANDSLNFIIDTGIPLPPAFNSVTVDSIMQKEKKYYGLLVEYSNPVYNLFAVYDSEQKLYLIDRSLNGFLKLTTASANKVDFFIVEEDFNSKDSIKLGRISLYTTISDTMFLSFRSFSSLTSGSTSLSSEITLITPDSIVVRNSYIIDKKAKSDVGTYFYDKESLTFYSGVNSFNSKVMELIKGYKRKPLNPAITDKISALKSTGVQTSIDSINRYNNYKDRTNKFSIFIPEGWRFIRNVKPTIELKKEVSGTRIYNKEIDASFLVVKIGENENAEAYISSKLENNMHGHYVVRFNEKIKTGENYYRFFEISCISLKYLIIFECPVKYYEENKQVFENMISSFGIEC